jgi:predicted kinase
MNKLILIAGLPGVGKSTLSRRVAEQENAEIVDIDDFKRNEEDPGLIASQIAPPEVRWRYYEKALAHAFSLKVSTVVMDETFCFHSLRERLEDRCFLQGVEVQWIEVRCNSEMVERRLLEKVRVGHLLSPQEAVQMHHLFKEIWEEFPSQKNNHVVVHTDDE